MSVTERPSYLKSSFQIPALSEYVLLAIIAAAFLALHVATGALLINAAGPVTTTQEDAKPSLYD